MNKTESDSDIKPCSIGLTTQSASPGRGQAQGGQNSLDSHLIPVKASCGPAISVLSSKQEVFFFSVIIGIVYYL